MNKKIKYFSILIIASLISCSNLHQQNVVGRYYVVALDGNSNNSLSYSINDDNSSFVDIVSEDVIAIGNNDNYIIVKRLLTTNDTTYYIVPIYKKFTYSPEKEVLGPLKKEEFTIGIKRLGIENISFSKNL